MKEKAFTITLVVLLAAMVLLSGCAKKTDSTPTTPTAAAKEINESDFEAGLTDYESSLNETDSAYNDLGDDDVSGELETGGLQ